MTLRPMKKMYLPLKKYKPQNTKKWERVNCMVEAKL